MATKQQISSGIDQINAVLEKGKYLASMQQPCAALAYHDEGKEKPWRIADDHTSESYATLDAAIAGAKSWCEAMAG